MSDTERVRAWRQRLKDNGLVPMTIWVKAETKARYEDLALQSHHSASELAQLALDAYRPDPALVSAPVTDTEQIRSIVHEELDEAMAIITATITAIVTDTARETLPALVETALQRYVTDTVPDTETATPQEPDWLNTVEAFVSDMATDTDTATAGSALPQEPLVPSLSATDTATVTETEQPLHNTVPGETPVADTATATAMEAGAGVPALAREERSVADTATATAMEAGAGIPAPAREERTVADTYTDTETDTSRTHGGQRRLTPLQAAELRGKRAAGMSIKQLMQQYGLSMATVHRYLTAPPGA
jgi:hypothetical protein